MAHRIQALFRLVADTYDGRAERLWTEGARTGPRSPAGSRRSPADLPRAARGDYGVEGSRRSMADVTDAASLAEVRAFKRESKAAARATGLTLGSLRFLDSGTGIP
jgi:hypothetical protein